MSNNGEHLFQKSLFGMVFKQTWTALGEDGDIEARIVPVDASSHGSCSVLIGEVLHTGIMIIGATRYGALAGCPPWEGDPHHLRQWRCVPPRRAGAERGCLVGTQLVRFERCPLVLESSRVVCVTAVCSSWRFLAGVSFFFCLLALFLSFFLVRFVGIPRRYLLTTRRGQTQ